MNYLLLIVLAPIITNEVRGSEVFSSPIVKIEDKVRENLNFFQGEDEPVCQELKTAEDPGCQIYLGWGHTRDAHDVIGSSDSKCGIGMGCNSGIAGVGALEDKPQYWRFQRGSNGTYYNYAFQGTQNGGLNPVTFDEENYIPKAMNLNSHLGFMRLTQYHWLQLHNYAHDELLNKKCSSVRIQFLCVDADYDLDQAELNKRLDAYKTKMTIDHSDEWHRKLLVELKILQRVEPLKGCFKNDQVDGLPHSCNQKIDITSSNVMKPHCKQWVEDIQSLPQHSWGTKKSLPKPSAYPYPKDGPIH